MLLTDLFELFVFPNHGEYAKKAYCILSPGKVMWDEAFTI